MPTRPVRAALAGLLAAGLLAAPAAAQPPDDDEVLVSLDFTNAELSEVIDTIARLTSRNFIYDDRVRGRVTIVSPTRIPLDQAYAVFESVLQVKGFTTVTSPGGAIKVIPIREAKESSVETVQSGARPPDRDRFVTRLIPLRYIEADPIVNTLKPLVSKDAAMVAYEPTNTVILTESASNIRRIISILEAIDVEIYKEELAVIRVEHADAATLADHISEIYSAEVASAGTAAARARARRAARTPTTPTPSTPGLPGARVRIITDERTNSLIVLAARQQLDDVRDLVAKLDVPVIGGGRIHVYYLKHADAEELAGTLSALISGQPQAPAGGQGAQAQALRVAVSELSEGITITADPATNSLVVQASQEGFAALSQVIEKLDIERPQVLVEALIMEVLIGDATDLGFNGVVRYFSDEKGNTDGTIISATDTSSDSSFMSDAMTGVGGVVAGPGGAMLARLLYDARGRADSEGNRSGPVIEGIIRAAATDSSTNILSAPHILTSDNERAEIRVGDNIPIITSRVQSAAGIDTPSNLATSVNVERQDIGVTLSVTPQITEGDTLRLEIQQEITGVNTTLTGVTGDPANVGVALSSRKIENVVVVNDGDTVVIGGLIGDNLQDTITKIPFLGDIPILGWLFKTKGRSLTKTNLLVFLTPHIIRSPEDMEFETIRKREQFAAGSRASLDLSEAAIEEERDRRREAEETGEPYLPLTGESPLRTALIDHQIRYPLERMRAIEQQQREERERARAARADDAAGYYVQAAIFGDEAAAAEALTRLIDAGLDGSLLSSESGGAVLYEIRLGPYATVHEANEVSELVRRAHGLAPAVLLAQPESEAP